MSEVGLSKTPGFEMRPRSDEQIEIQFRRIPNTDTTGKILEINTHVKY